MNSRLIIIMIVICIISKTSFSALQDEADTLSVVNGLVYEDVHIQPLQDFPVYIAELDSFYNLVRLDTIFTDEEGKFTAELAMGFYTIIPWLDGYITLNYYENIELTDTLYNLEFRIISPVISLGEDTLIIQSLSGEPVEKKLLVTNQGTGELIYSCALYTDYEQQDGLASTVESDWKLIFRDGHDYDFFIGYHDNWYKSGLRSCQYNCGRVFLTSGHPEIINSPDCRKIFSNAVKWCPKAEQ